MDSEKLWRLINANWEFNKWVPRGELERMMDSMVKTMPAEDTSVERKPWKKAQYAVRIRWDKSEYIDNQFYRSEVSLNEKYGKRPEGQYHWLNEKEEKVYASHPNEAKQWKLVLEVQVGDKKGDWLWAYVSPYYKPKKEGGWYGKAAALALAVDEEFDLTQGIDFENDIGDKPFLVSVEPDAKNAQYGKVTDYFPMDLEAKAKLVTNDVTTKDGAKCESGPDPKFEDDIPF